MVRKMPLAGFGKKTIKKQISLRRSEEIENTIRLSDHFVNNQKITLLS